MPPPYYHPHHHPITFFHSFVHSPSIFWRTPITPHYISTIINVYKLEKKMQLNPTLTITPAPTTTAWSTEVTRCFTGFVWAWFDEHSTVSKETPVSALNSNIIPLE